MGSETLTDYLRHSSDKPRLSQEFVNTRPNAYTRNLLMCISPKFLVVVHRVDETLEQIDRPAKNDRLVIRRNTLASLKYEGDMRTSQMRRLVTLDMTMLDKLTQEGCIPKYQDLGYDEVHVSFSLGVCKPKERSTALARSRLKRTQKRKWGETLKTRLVMTPLAPSRPPEPPKTPHRAGRK